MENSTATAIIASGEKKGVRGIWIAGLGCLSILALWPLAVRSNYFIYIGTLVLLNSIGAMALHLIIRMGQMSLGQAAFLGIGSYTSAILTTKFGIPFPAALAASVVLAALAGGVIGPIVLRLRGVYFVLVTFTFGEIVRLIFVEWTSMTGGPEGIDKILFPYPLVVSSNIYYFIALAAAFLCFLFVSRFLACPFGHAIDAIKESEALAASTGVPVFKYKLIVFIIACGMVGLQGSLTAHFVHYISPLGYDFSQSLNFVVINVIGGMNTLIGPLIGTLFIVSLPEVLRSSVEYQWVFYGIVLIAVMAYEPGGLAEIADRIYRAVLSRRGR